MINKSIGKLFSLFYQTTVLVFESPYREHVSFLNIGIFFSKEAPPFFNFPFYLLMHLLSVKFYYFKVLSTNSLITFPSLY